VFDEQRLLDNLNFLADIRSASGCRVLYSIKASPFKGVLKRTLGLLDGFSVSSLFEARLAREVAQGRASLHITTPGLRRDELPEIGDLCDTVSFNSLTQLERFPFLLGGGAKIGLRINPQLSYLADPRYDPCRSYSKLGAPLPQVVESWRSGRLSASGLSGLHLHTNFASDTFRPLQTTITHLQHHLPELVKHVDWINLGGGYRFQTSKDLPALLATIDHIQTVWKTEVYLEPGTSVVNDAGMLVASVIDQFESDGKTIAILDTSVNHLPEVFEYQIKPRLHGESCDGPYAITLAGCTCLSGDLFGDYRFTRPLKIGDRVVFENVGAYSLIKASRFNGQNLPSIYFLGTSGELTLSKAYNYDDYRSQWSDIESIQQASKTGVG
jgi:carboxynorspermidine decarboxylase